MLRKFSLRRKNDTSSIVSTSSSIFENLPYISDSIVTDFGDIPKEPEIASKVPGYVHHAVEHSPSPRSTPRTFSLKQHSSQSKQDDTVLKLRERLSSFATSSKNAQSNEGRDTPAETCTCSPSKRSSAHFDTGSTTALPGNLRHTSSVRTVTTLTSFRIPQDSQVSSRLSCYKEYGSNSREFLKIKLTFKPADETLALKYLRSKLTSVQEFVNAINAKLYDRYKLKHQDMVVFLAFSDKSLKKIVLGDSGSSLSKYIDSLTMDYIKSKSRIYLEVFPGC